MRRAGAVLVAALLLVAAVVVQVTVLTRVDLPGATPHLVLVTAAAIGAARGRIPGAVAGFAGGLLLDLAPPADHAAGQWALVLTVAGYLAGRLAADQGRSIVVRALAVGALAALATAGYLVVSTALGAHWRPPSELLVLLAATVAYAVVLALPAVPVTSWLLARTAPPATGW